jgi:hypothetical protein
LKEGPVIRLSAIVCVLACLLVSRAYCQEDKPAEVPTYDVTLTEFQLKSGHDPELSFADIIRDFQDREKKDNITLAETVRLTLQANFECTVRFGKQVQVTKGIINNPRGVQRVTQTMQVGTMAQIRVTPEDGKLILKLRYTASRLGDEAPEDAPPDVLSSTYNATVAVEPGKPALVGGTDQENASYLIVYVR